MSVLILASLISVGLIGVSAGIYFYGERRLNLIAADVAKADTELETLAAEKAALMVEREALMAENVGSVEAVLEGVQFDADEPVAEATAKPVITSQKTKFAGGPETTASIDSGLRWEGWEGWQHWVPTMPASSPAALMAQSYGLGKTRAVIRNINRPDAVDPIVISFGTGEDVIWTPEDVISGGTGKDVISGGTGEDVISGFGERLTDFVLSDGTTVRGRILNIGAGGGVDRLKGGGGMIVDTFTFDYDPSDVQNGQVEIDGYTMIQLGGQTPPSLARRVSAGGMPKGPIPASVRRRAAKVRGKAPD